MHKYTIAHSFLMIMSVIASDPFHVRQLPAPGVGTTAATTSAQTTVAQTSASTTPLTTTSNSAKSTSSSSSIPTSTSAATTVSTSIASTTAAATTSSASTTAPTSRTGSASSPLSASSPSLQETVSASTSTDAQGSPVTVTFTSTMSAQSSSDTPSSTSSSQDSSSSSTHTGTIIGLSVAGGVAALAIVAFIVWKLTRKRFSDLDDPDEAIKWPELNQEHTDVGNDGLSPQVSNLYSSNPPSRNPSTFDNSDPYAVPPLPQFNPNQPYRDDPSASSTAGFYDPYRGPIPQTFHDGSVEGHENIPMNTYPSSSRSRSPGPGIAYDMAGRGSPAPGRASPALGPAYDTGIRGSPAPGRTISPGPAAALGMDRRPSYDVLNPLTGQPEMSVRNKYSGPNILA